MVVEVFAQKTSICFTWPFVYTTENRILSGKNKLDYTAGKGDLVLQCSRILRNSVLNLGHRFTNWLSSCIALKLTAVLVLN